MMPKPAPIFNICILRFCVSLGSLLERTKHLIHEIIDEIEASHAGLVSRILERPRAQCAPSANGPSPSLQRTTFELGSVVIPG